ncbi:MAG: L,D-transpeptidase family protein [Planctomycetaceae bacterium]
MYERRPHPLQSFKFWFLALACVGATTAWKMGWLAELSTPAENETVAVQEVGLDHVAPPDWMDETTPSSPPVQGQQEPALEATTTGPSTPSRHLPFEVPSNSKLAHSGPYGHESHHGEANSQSQWNDPVRDQNENGYGRLSQYEPVAPSVASRGNTNSGSPFGPARTEFYSADVAAPPAQYVPTPVVTPETTGIQRVSATQPEFPSRPGFDGVENAYSAQPVRNTLDLAAIDGLIHAGQDVEAHRKLSALYWEHPDARGELMERIDQTARRIYFQPNDHYLEPYVVQPGDMLQTIARDYQVSWEYLAKLNRTDPKKIRPGQKLKVIRGPFNAVVDLSRYEMTIHAHGYYVASFPIGIGRDASTPRGSFTVSDKVPNPVYYGPDRVIAADDPANPLGEYWIAIGNGYGIHGTNDPSSIGRAESRGCIRLSDSAIADVYDLLTAGSEVVIRP